MTDRAVSFVYYLHDNASSGEFAEMVLEDQLGMGYIEDDDGNEVKVDLEPLMQKIGRPFYEVKLECTLNLDTGEVKILGVST